MTSHNALTRRQAISGALALTGTAACTTSDPNASAAATVSINGANWFDGQGFRPRTGYSVNGRFSFQKPSRIDTALDLPGTWLIPPFAEAHSHNINGGTTDPDVSRKAIARYLADGVFYAKIQGNIPLSDAQRAGFGLNTPGGLDVALAQGMITSTNGWPLLLRERIFPEPGYTRETMKDDVLFMVDSDADLAAKWPLVLARKPDFIKAFLWFSDEYAVRSKDPVQQYQSALDPALLPKVAARAHSAGLRLSVHCWNAYDFHVAVSGGADEITHLPPFGEITAADAALASRRKVTLITTGRTLEGLGPNFLPPTQKPAAVERQKANIRRLRGAGVKLAVGSDSTAPGSAGIEADYLRGLGVFSDAELLAMWTGASARAIFPKRRIGELTEGYEAGFVALAANPLEDWSAIRKIITRFKQGRELNLAA